MTTCLRRLRAISNRPVRRVRRVRRVLAVGGALLAVGASALSAVPASATSTTGSLAAAGTRIALTDTSGVVLVDPGTLSVNQCSAGWFCTWTSVNYTGSFTYRTGTGFKALGLEVNSLWNNRSGVARFYNNNGTAFTCIEDGAKKSSISLLYQNSIQVNLLSGATC